MPTTQTILTVFHLFLSIGLIGLVLMQHGRGADAGAAFGSGASATVFGARGSGSFLSRTTAMLAILFFVTSMALAYFAAQVGEPQGLMEGVEVPVAPAPVRREIPAVPVPAGSETHTEVPAVPVPAGGEGRTEAPAVPGVPVPAGGEMRSEVSSFQEGAAQPAGDEVRTEVPVAPPVPAPVGDASGVPGEMVPVAPEIGRSDGVTVPQEGGQTGADSGGNRSSKN